MQTYAEMVDSGVEWLGQIPASWSVKKFSNLYIKTNAGEVIPKEFWDSGGQHLVYTASQTPIKSIFSKFPHSKLTTSSDILIARNGDGVIHDPVAGSIYTNVVQRVALDPKVLDKKFVIYALRASLVYVHGQSNGDFIVSLNMGMWNSTRLALPDLITQQKIADFLDAETGRIDSLIAKQERLFELLEEKRRATITHAVTRGLDPNVELKETNIPWLGQIPTHWELARVSSLYRRKSEKGFPNEELLSVYRDHGVIPKKSRDDNHNAESEDLSRYQLVLPNDLVTNKMKTWQGSIAVSNIKGIVSPAYFIFQPYNNDMLPEYIHFLLRSDRYIAQYKSISKGIRPGQWDLDIEQFKTMRITVPPIDEQRKIVKAIKMNEEKTKVLKQKIQTQITLLRERRTSLISHAVTGKVKI